LWFPSEEDNLQGWFFAEEDGNQIKKQKHPLLLRQMPVVMSKLQEFKVRHFSSRTVSKEECGANNATIQSSMIHQADGGREEEWAGHQTQPGPMDPMRRDTLTHA